jgi:hypothetical protein
VENKPDFNWIIRHAFHVYVHFARYIILYFSIFIIIAIKITLNILVNYYILIVIIFTFPAKNTKTGELERSCGDEPLKNQIIKCTKDFLKNWFLWRSTSNWIDSKFSRDLTTSIKPGAPHLVVPSMLNSKFYYIVNDIKNKIKKECIYF